MTARRKHPTLLRRAVTFLGMDDDTREALATIVARLDTLHPPLSAEGQVAVIAAEADAAEQVIEAQAAAQVDVMEASTEQAETLIDAEADAETETGGDGDVRPEADHWYFKTFGRK